MADFKTLDQTASERFLPTSSQSSRLRLQKGDVENPNAEEYEPYAKREVEHPTTNAETLLHLLKGSLGTGVLSMPNAFHNAGYALGIVGTILTATICTYCVHILILCEYELCKRKKIPSLNYPLTMKYALEEGPEFGKKFATFSRHLANFFLLCYQIGSCCIYVVFVAANVKDVVEEYYDPLDIRIYMAIFLILFILINYIKNLKYLAPFSTLANILTVFGFAIILYYVFKEPLKISDKHAIGAVEDLPLFFGTVLFSLESIGVIMPLENEMKEPQYFIGYWGILNRAMIIIVILYSAVGFFGYLRYGENSLGSITLNLPQADVLSQSVKILFSFSMFVSHALQCYVALDILWNDYLQERIKEGTKKRFLEYVLRTTVVIFTALFASAIPNLEYFISLVGTFCLTFLALFCPAVIETSTYWYHKTGVKFGMMCFKNGLIVCFSIFGSIVGCYTTIKEIVTQVL